MQRPGSRRNSHALRVQSQNMRRKHVEEPFSQMGYGYGAEKQSLHYTSNIDRWFSDVLGNYQVDDR